MSFWDDVGQIAEDAEYVALSEEVGPWAAGVIIQEQQAVIEVFEDVARWLGAALFGTKL